MFQAGAKVKDVAAQFGVQERTVYRWLATWYQHGVLKLPRMGRRKKMSAAAQEVLVRELDLCPKMFWDEVQWIVWARTGEIYSLSLVRKVAAEHGFRIVVGSTHSKHIDRYPPPFRHRRRRRRRRRECVLRLVCRVLYI